MARTQSSSPALAGLILSGIFDVLDHALSDEIYAVLGVKKR